ncbi:MAG TPA: glutathione S-transferase family protein [Casimicrobiaceae bacterium]|nr:glutathione S-transferase family protein [Casimicrobiaceae bacterium]
MLKILGRKTSSNVQKVLWCCGEIGLAFERSDVGGPFGGNQTPEYLALNPNGLVPTIDDDGFVLWESNTIVRYLAARHASGSLWPTDIRRRADADRWMDWQQTTLGPPMGVLFRALLRSPADAVEPAELESAKRRAASAFSILDVQLGRSRFVAGPDLTMGDIALGFAPHRWFILPIERPSLPRVERWYRELCERPAYREHVVSA